MNFAPALPITSDWPHLRRRFGGTLLFEGCNLTAPRGMWGVGFVAVDFVANVVDEGGGFDRIRCMALETRIARRMRLMAIEGIATVSATHIRASMVNSDAEGLLDPMDEGFWHAFGRQVLSQCNGVIVLPVPGWEASAEVLAAVTWALESHRPVYVLADDAETGGGRG